MSATSRVWIVEEVATLSGIGQRQTMGEYNMESDGTWGWIRPDDRMSLEAIAEWDRVMKKLSDVGGEDLRSLVCFAGLLDHCLKVTSEE